MSISLDELMRRADPMASVDLPQATGAADDVLYSTILSKRRASTDTGQGAEMAPDSASRSPSRRGVLVAVAAFVAILVSVGVIVAVLSGGGVSEVVDQSTTTVVPETTQAPPTTSVPVTTQAPATTQAAPVTTTPLQVDPADRAVIDDFVATLNSGAWEASLAALSPNALVWDGLIAGGGSEAPLALDEFGDAFVGLLRYWAVQGTRMDINSCSIDGSDRINCRGTFSDVVIEASPFGPASMSVTFDVDTSDQITYLFVRKNAASINGSYAFFNDWLVEMHPGESLILYGGSGSPRFDDEALALWSVRVSEWVATLAE